MTNYPDSHFCKMRHSGQHRNFFNRHQLCSVRVLCRLPSALPWHFRSSPGGYRNALVLSHFPFQKSNSSKPERAFNFFWNLQSQQNTDNFTWPWPKTTSKGNTFSLKSHTVSHSQTIWKITSEVSFSILDWYIHSRSKLFIVKNPKQIWETTNKLIF